MQTSRLPAAHTSSPAAACRSLSLVALLLLAFLCCCSKGGATPAIDIEMQFLATPTSTTVGGSVTLVYDFSEGEGTIEPGVGKVSKNGTTVVTPASTTTYTLTVRRGGNVLNGEATNGDVAVASVTVDVGPAPTIASFVANPSTITSGEPVALVAVFDNGNGSVDHGAGSLASGLAKIVNPTATTTYTLTVMAMGGTNVTRTVTVTVVPAPSIASFTATPPTLTLGGNELLPEFSGGTGTIAPATPSIVNPVTSGAPILVAPTVATTYTLTVTNAAGRAVSVSLTIGNAPTLTATCSSILPGGTTWVTPTFGPGSAMLSENGASFTTPVVSGVPVAVTPTNTSPGFTTTYTLTVTFGASVVTRTVAVTNVGLTAASPCFPVNEGTDLTAIFGAGSTAVLQPGNVAMQSGMPLFVRPSVATRYVLQVSQGGGCNLETVLAVHPNVCLAGGTKHSIALRSNGTVWTWGWNWYGQLGLGNQTNSTVPVAIPGLGNVIAVAAGSEHCLVVRLDGSIAAWGSNDHGQLGDGTLINRWSPTLVQGLPPARRALAVSCGDDVSRVLLDDGTVWAWGWNDRGQLGDGSTNDSSAPRQVQGLVEVVLLGGGEAHGLVVLRDGSMRAWGHNVSGQIGDGSFTDRYLPVQVLGMTNVSRIGCGGEAHSLAIRGDGSAWAWGNNLQGALGDGTVQNRTVAVPISTFAPQAIVPAGVWAGQAQSYAVREVGGVLTTWAWGRNNWGQLGTGTTSLNATTMPQQVNTPVQFVMLGTGWSHGLGVRAAYGTNQGTVWAWGKNDSDSLLGTGGTSNVLSPTVVPGFTLW